MRAIYLALFAFLSACTSTKLESTPVIEPIPPQNSISTPSAALPENNEPPAGAAAQFSTDFSIHSVPYDQILSGGPPKDGIPSIDNPKFESVAQADAWLDPAEPVIQVQVGAEARAYPIQILMWHEIVNDEFNAIPLLVTFCPLCNTAIAFERTLDGQVLDFGTTGRLRFSNLIMYDRQTETWWQQANGEAIVGDLTGQHLTFYPALIVSWQDFRDAFPKGSVLSRDTGYARSYGQNPYAGYDNINSSPFLFQGPITPDDLPPMTRVLTVELNSEAVAFTYDVLKEEGVANEAVGEQAIVVFWQPGVASPFTSSAIAGGNDVGAAAAFSRQLGDRTLTFSVQNGRILDQETGSAWNIFGFAESGPLEGAQLEQVISINHFWFSWAAFMPETRIYQP
jgi:hypothetical protein